jgi:subtilisin family serine protease
MEAARRLKPQAEQLRAAVSALGDALRGDRIVVEATVMPNFLANAYFPSAFLEYVSAEFIGTGYASAPLRTRTEMNPSGNAPTKKLYLAGTDETLDRLDLLLANPDASRIPARVKDDLRAIEAISLPVLTISVPDNPELPISNRDLPLWEAVLHPVSEMTTQNAPISMTSTLLKLQTLVAGVGGRLEPDWVRAVDGLLFVPLRIPSLEAAESVSRFNPLRSLHRMPSLALPESTTSEYPSIPFDPPDELDPSNSISEDPLRVAVFDGGCDDSSPFYKARVRNIVVGAITPHSGAFNHGMLVTSAIIYGHSLDSPLRPAPVSVDHYQVLPSAGQKGFELYWLLDLIIERLSNEDYDVVNLSLGPRLETRDDYVDRWTAELDRLSYERNVLIVVAAGNTGESADEELRRVQIPGDVINGLTVGSTPQVVGRFKRAEYSSVGPGRAGARVKPTGVAFGGDPSNDFMGVDADGAMLMDYGTSFSAPLVVHGLATLASRIPRDCVTPSTLKSFAVHFAEACARGTKPTEVGHGAFLSDYDSVLNCPDNLVHVLYRGTIARDEYLPLAIPLPDLIQGEVKLRWTLTTTVACDLKDAVEYAKAGLEVAFRPHARRFTFSLKGSPPVTLDVQQEAAEVARLLGAGYSPSQQAVAATPPVRGKSEIVLREEGKWETIRSSSKKFKAGRLFRPRIDLSHIAREDGMLAYGTPHLDYSLLVTIESTEGLPLYDAVKTSFPILVPIVTPVHVSVDVADRSEGD